MLDIHRTGSGGDSQPDMCHITADEPGKIIRRAACGPRTFAPMWARPLLTLGEWAVYTALWSFDAGDDARFPAYDEVAERAMCSHGTVVKTIRKMINIGLLVPESGSYLMVETRPAELNPAVSA